MGSLAAKAEDQIVITKWAGLSGTYEITKKCYEQLHSRYASDFLEPVFDYPQWYSYEPEYRLAKEHDVHAMVEASYGGIFGAIFLLGYDSELGCMVDLRKIMLTQPTIEVSEFFHLNPYQLHSKGSMVMACSDGEKLVRELKKEGIPAVVAGHMTDEKARIVYLDDDCRYLTPPRTDHIFKVFTDPKYRKQYPKKIIEY